MNTTKVSLNEALGVAAVIGAILLLAGESGPKIIHALTASSCDKCSSCHLKLEFPDVKKKV